MALCKCGCGKPVKNKWAQGHNPKAKSGVTAADIAGLQAVWTQAGIPFGCCLCGCGDATNVATRTTRMFGHLAGQPVFYVRGHGYAKRVKHIEEDRGYVTPCWIWQLWKTRQGYGKLSIKEGGGRVTSKLAHRWMYEQVVGPIPEGLQLDHLCRQPSCVNPDHLEAVTHAENSRRAAPTKLTWEQVREIRRLIKDEGLTHKALGERYGVAAVTVSAIASGRNWRE